MSNSLVDFLKSNPFWAILIIILMILPIIGAVIHIILKAFGRRGVDNIPAMPEEPVADHESVKSNGGPPGEKDQLSKPDKKI